jgi:hypothetical protein
MQFRGEAQTDAAGIVDKRYRVLRLTGKEDGRGNVEFMICNACVYRRLYVCGASQRSCGGGTDKKTKTESRNRDSGRGGDIIFFDDPHFTKFSIFALSGNPLFS